MLFAYFNTYQQCQMLSGLTVEFFLTSNQLIDSTALHFERNALPVAIYVSSNV